MLQKIVKTGLLGSKGSASGKNAPRLSLIALDVCVTGNIVSQGEVQVDGRVEGDIRCQLLLLGESGVIEGEVVAEHVRIYGKLTGKISAATVMVASSGHVIGDVSHDGLEIEAGGHLEGHLLRRSVQPGTGRSGEDEPAKPSANSPADGGHKDDTTPLAVGMAAGVQA